MARVKQGLSACGGQINTALVARLNLSLRPRVAALRRRRATSCERAEGWGQQLALVQGYHHFVLPQARLRQALAEPMPTNGRGSAKGWRPWPPMQTVSNRIRVKDWGIKGVRA
jgi:hypothetical protein